jgi:hypothetical protein
MDNSPRIYAMNSDDQEARSRCRCCGDDRVITKAIIEDSLVNIRTTA